VETDGMLSARTPAHEPRAARGRRGPCLTQSRTRAAALGLLVCGAIVATGRAKAQPTGATAVASTREAAVGVSPPPLPRRRPPEACGSQLQAQLRLSGTVYDDRHPERSLAILGPPASRATGVYRCRSRIGAYRLLDVHPRAVLLDVHNENPCWLRLTRPNQPTQVASRPAQRDRNPARLRRTAFSSDELEQGIQTIRPGVYRVDRGLIERAITRAAALARGMRTRTIQQHGASVGVSLLQIPSGGLLEGLGMRRGDLLKTINGFQIASADGLLRARTQLSSAQRLSLSLVRSGQPMTLEYNVH
jgi:hypothetical protein